jgi:hypothetical protein
MRTAVLLLLAAVATARANEPSVTTIRVPDGGLQPQIICDAASVHLVYLKGPDRTCDVYYTRSMDGGVTWSPSVRVNSQLATAIATGTIRGARIALGRNGIVHVLWNGSDSHLYYSRSINSAGFEPQRSIMTTTVGIDGGSAITADAAGHVHIVFHAAPKSAPPGESSRRVFLARSDNDGKTFAPEQPIDEPVRGVCSCCSLTAALADGKLHVLYRQAEHGSERGIVLLTGDPAGQRFTSLPLDRWNLAACPMSNAAITPPLIAWQTESQLYLASLTDPRATIAPPGEAKPRKYPALATNRDGVTLLTWTENTAWAHGGKLAWQLFDASRRPLGELHKLPGAGVPAWSFPAAFTRPDGSFVIVY